jgi:CubicO group peptidase (beta-lactamase class C family)
MKRFLFTYLTISLTLGMLAIGSSCSGHDDSIALPQGSSTSDSTLIDHDILDSLVTAIDADVYGDVHSVLIHRRDSLVFERYFNGYYRDRHQAVYSVTKSFTSALIGIALERVDLTAVDENIWTYFSHYSNIANFDSLKESIQVEHLLTMTAGFEWDELSVPYYDPTNDVIEMYNSSDWVKYVLDLPMTDAPGSRFVYNSGVSMLLSAILTEATGLSAREYADAHLFDPLGVVSWKWEAAPRNPAMSIGGWGLHLRPIDMIAFGRLYLNGGRWRDTQIVSESWVDASTRAHTSNSERTNYGYQWWMYSDWIVDEGHVEVNDIFIAVGRGGQYIWVVPQYDLVVVSTAWNDNNGKSSSPLFFRYIIPAVRAADAAAELQTVH